MEKIHLPTLAWLWDEDWHIEMDFKVGLLIRSKDAFALVQNEMKGGCMNRP